MFQLIEETFYEMAFLVEPPIARSLNFAVFATRNDGDRLLPLNQFQNVVHVVASIGNHGLPCEIHGLKHFKTFHAVVAISSGQFKS